MKNKVAGPEITSGKNVGIFRYFGSKIDSYNKESLPVKFKS